MEARIVGRPEAGQKLFRYLQKMLPEAPDSFLHKMLRKKNIELSGHGKCTGAEILAEGDTVRFFLSGETFRKFGGTAPGGKPSPEGTGFEAKAPIPAAERLARAHTDVIYEDEDFLFVSKPAGLLVQGDRSGAKSLADLLEACSPPDSLTKWSPMHRLDRNTSGLVLCGKTVGGLDIRKKYNLNVLAVRESGKPSMAVTSDTLLKENQTILVLGKWKDIQKCFRI